MSVDVLLGSLMDRGVEFRVVDGLVHWGNADGKMTADELAALKAERDEVVSILSRQHAHTDPIQSEFRHGTTFDGTPKTWTGKIVSLDAWRRLSEWEKHGPDGRMWNGKTRRWEKAE